MCDQRAKADLAVASIAERQHGVISVWQLRDVGLDKHRVRHRALTGRLHQIHRGVYAVGHPRLSREGRWMAAVLACGDGAVISHRSAASLWELLPTGSLAVSEVSVPSAGGRRRRDGIRLHRCSSLDQAAVTRRHGIPVTTPARTVSDLRRTVPEHESRRAIRQAELLRLPIDSMATQDGTRSELEHRFLELCRQSGIPAPQVNVRIGRFIVDFVWADRRLVVETDGYRYHRGRIAFEDDRSRDLELRALGYDVIRLTYRQVAGSPREVCSAVRKALSA